MKKITFTLLISLLLFSCSNEEKLNQKIVELETKNKDCDFLVESKSAQILDPQKIFEEYYREEVSKEGFGLGLNLVKRICSEENVGIKLESGENWASFTYTFKDIL